MEFNINEFEKQLEFLRQSINDKFNSDQKNTAKALGVSRQYISGAKDKCYNLKVDRLIEYYKKLFS